MPPEGLDSSDRKIAFILVAFILITVAEKSMSLSLEAKIDILVTSNYSKNNNFILAFNAL